jgi:hypothetical protein
VHEVARCRTPLLLSRIPAFIQYFNTSDQAFFFDTDDPDSLSRVIEEVIDETNLVITRRLQRITQGIPLTYGDPTTPYQSFYDWTSNRRNRDGISLMDLQLRIREFDRLVK